MMGIVLGHVAPDSASTDMLSNLGTLMKLEPGAPVHSGPVIGASGDGVWDLALELASDLPKGRLLELAVGGGFLAAKLTERGFDVVGMDLGVQWTRTDIPFIRADLDSPLPFSAASFDTVVFTEGLGYIENSSALMREVFRVLKPGGAFLVTMPNILSLESRVKFFLTGSYRWFPHPTNKGETKHQLLDVYRDPTRITTLIFGLQRHGFRVERTVFGGGRPLLWLVGLGWLLAGYLRAENALRKKRKTPALANDSSTLFRTNVGVLAFRLDDAP